MVHLPDDEREAIAALCERHAGAHPSGIVEACDLIDLALQGLAPDAYRRDPIIRVAVERQFVTIGEAVSSLPLLAPGAGERHPGERAAVIPRGTPRRYPPVLPSRRVSDRAPA